MNANYPYGKGRRSKKDILGGVQEPILTSKKLENNTIEYTTKKGRFIRLHDTDIISYRGKFIILNTGGFRTRLTRERLNKYLPNIRIWTDRSVWYIKDGLDQKSVFYEGMKLEDTGFCDKIVSKIKDRDKTTEKWIKEINIYCKKIAQMEELPSPSTGDCWLCLVRDKNRKTIGAGFGDNSHIKDHIRTRDIHGSLILNALEHAGYQYPEIIASSGARLGRGYMRKNIVCAVRKYLKAQLGLAR